jgi:hypothetical protein
MLIKVIISSLCLLLIPAQIAMGQFQLSSPEGMAVEYVILVTPIQFNNQEAVTFTVVVLNYDLKAAALKTTFSPSNVFAVTGKNKNLQATHFAFGGGWMVGSADSSALEAYQVKTEQPSGLLYAVKLGHIAAEADLGKKVFAWFIFPNTNPETIKQITIGEVTLLRSKR